MTAEARSSSFVKRSDMLIIARAGAAALTTMQERTDGVFSGQVLFMPNQNPTLNMRKITMTLMIPLIMIFLSGS